MPIRGHRWLAGLLALLAGCSSESKNGPDIDAQLGDLLSKANVTALSVPAQDPAQVSLGQALMFDKILSGNRNIACATCHHPLQKTGDGIPLSIGEGATGLGPSRTGPGAFIPRHAPDLFNRGAPQWTILFWDGRVAVKAGGGFTTPANASLPAGVGSVLAAQAMFPVESPDEMRGGPGEANNELGEIANGDFPAVWDGIMQRLRAIPKYDTLFQAAFGKSVNAAGFEDAANAIAAFQASAFSKYDTPFDAYLAGDHTALSDQQKRGALLFFGKANCAKCHLGPLLTDQKFHNIAVPQLGPGRPPSAGGLDIGREEQTGLPSDRFLFRTPPLRNVALSGPYFHNGAFATLLGAVKHYVNVTRSLKTYDPTQLPASLRPTVKTGDVVWNDVLSTLDPIVADTLKIQDVQVTEIVAFLQALTDPSAQDLSSLIPASVPSGLPVGD
jgi:cytochrome c peroxidase